MDPIHPIIPGGPQLGPIGPSRRLGRVDRDGSREQSDQPPRRRAPQDDAEWDRVERRDTPRDQAGEDDDGPPGIHIDITV